MIRILFGLVIAGLTGQTDSPPKIAGGEPPPNLAYSCQLDQTLKSLHKQRTRLYYDHGKFREEHLDPVTGKTMLIRLYNRDGQVISFVLSGSPPWKAGIDLDAVIYHSSRKDPADYARRMGVAGSASIVVPEPRPETAVQSFTEAKAKRYVVKGNAVVDGKPCTIYKSGFHELKVWRGLVLAWQDEGRTGQVTNLAIKRSLDARLFELPSGALVKVPKDLHVRLPSTVRRVEYPGDGLIRRNAAAQVRQR